jgi:hypothetical protein
MLIETTHQERISSPIHWLRPMLTVPSKLDRVAMGLLHVGLVLVLILF